MNLDPHLWWYVARAGGIVAWVLLALSVIWGLLLSTGILGRHPAKPWLLDLHRYLGGLAVAFTAVHVAGLVADSTVHFAAPEILVPFASAWRPGAVAWGVVALYLLVAVEVTSLLMARLPRRWWRAVHFSSFALFLVAALHGASAGTDATGPVYRAVSLALIVATLFLALVRVLGGRRRPAERVPAAARARSARGLTAPHAA